MHQMDFWASPETIEDSSWYADEEASHHVTKQFKMSALKRRYNSMNFLLVANMSYQLVLCILLKKMSGIEI